jgi:hypothetical protein
LVLVLLCIANIVLYFLTSYLRTKAGLPPLKDETLTILGAMAALARGRRMPKRRRRRL